jgi:hypothetical protein
VRSALDELAVSGSTTEEAVACLDGIAAGSHSALRIPGTYPHAAWQGTRIEGFVVAQGDAVSAEYASDVRKIADDLRRLVLQADPHDPSLRCVSTQLQPPAAAELSQAVGRRAFGQRAMSAVARAAPSLARLQVRNVSMLMHSLHVNSSYPESVTA